MRIRIIGIIGLFISLIITQSCVYQLDEGNIFPVEEPDPEEIHVTLLDPEQKSFYLTGAHYFELKIENADTSTYVGMEVWMNERKVTSLQKSTVFDLSAHDYENGTYNLRINVFRKSASKSLANQLEPVVEEYTFEWEVVVDKTTPAPVQLQSEVVDGQLVLSWTKPEKYNFDYYEISKNNRSRHNISLDSNRYIDKSYLGGEAQYTISLTSQLLKSKSAPLDIDVPPLPSSGFEIIDNNTIRLYWGRPTFASNIKEVILGESETNGIIYSGDVNTTEGVFHEDLPFGKEYSKSLFLIPDRSLDLYTHPTVEYSIKLPYYLGSVFPSLNGSLETSYMTNSIYSGFNYPQGNDSLVRMNMEGEILAVWKDKRISTLYPEALTLSFDYKYVCYLDGKILRILDPPTMQEIKHLDLNGITHQSRFPLKIDFLNDHRIQIQYHDAVYAIDVDTEEIVFQHINQAEGTLSFNGQYYIISKDFSTPNENSYYKVNGNDLELLYRDTRDYVQFSNGNKIVYTVEEMGEYHMQYYDLELDAVIQDIPLEDMQAPKVTMIDPVKQRLVITGTNKWMAVAYSTGEILYEGRRVLRTSINLSGDNVISNNGYIISLQELNGS